MRTFFENLLVITAVIAAFYILASVLVYIFTPKTVAERAFKVSKLVYIILVGIMLISGILSSIIK